MSSGVDAPHGHVGSPTLDSDEDELARGIRDHLQARLPAALDLLHELVAINSFTRNVEGVNAVGDLCAHHFAELGFSAERVESASARHGDHLVLTREGRSKVVIGLVSHLDTVFTVAEEAEHHFRWDVQGDRIYGPGTVDIKGGTAMIWFVLDALRAVAPEAFEQVTWMVLCNAAEEELARDFGALLRERLREHGVACLVFEGCRREEETWHVVTRRKGMATFRIDVSGRGAHAGSAHHRGSNAVVQLARAIDRIHALTDYERGLTVNVGVASGGTVVNRVPHQATARVEMRAFDPDALEDGIAGVYEVARQEDVVSAEGGYRCRVDAHMLASTSPWPDNDGSRELFRVWRDCSAQLGMRLAPESRGGLSDGNRVWSVLPTLDGLGPHGDNLHCSERDPATGKDQEYVSRGSFVPRALLNVQALRRLIADRFDDTTLDSEVARNVGAHQAHAGDEGGSP